MMILTSMVTKEKALMKVIEKSIWGYVVAFPGGLLVWLAAAP